MEYFLRVAHKFAALPASSLQTGWAGSAPLRDDESKLVPWITGVRIPLYFPPRLMCQY